MLAQVQPTPANACFKQNNRGQALHKGSIQDKTTSTRLWNAIIIIIVIIIIIIIIIEKSGCDKCCEKSPASSVNPAGVNEDQRANISRYVYVQEELEE
ncbi:hypothetical protein GE21DRAFT_1081970 [Neurospora crassa]|nr:hypothetical protein GE21DRAFT_1081970 [Neurospora crassa]